MALRDQILNSNDRVPVAVDMTKFGWPDGIYVQPMSADLAIDISAMTDKTNPSPGELKKAAQMMYMHSLVDEDGSPVFDKESIKLLFGKGTHAIDHLGGLIRSINAMDDEAIDELGEASTPAGG